jgi:hypothetical protein
LHKIIDLDKLIEILHFGGRLALVSQTVAAMKYHENIAEFSIDMHKSKLNIGEEGFERVYMYPLCALQEEFKEYSVM